MLPNGVAIARPPAKSLPVGSLWQAVQSPARARYSPRRMTCVPGSVGAGAALPGVPAARGFGAGPGPHVYHATPASTASSTSSVRANRAARRMLLLAAAGKRHAHEVAGFRREVRRRLLRGEPRAHGGDIGLGEARGD